MIPDPVRQSITPFSRQASDRQVVWPVDEMVEGVFDGRTDGHTFVGCEVTILVNVRDVEYPV